MLTQAICQTLPFAVAGALSPIPIIAVIVMLGTPRARTNAPAFAVGWVVGLTAISVIVLLISNGTSEPDSAPSTAASWISLAVGVALVALAARKWRGRPRRGEQPEMPGWMTAVDGFSAGRSLGLGLTVSMANPKALALTSGAALRIAEAGLSRADSAVAVAVFVLISSLTVLGPVAAFLVAGDRSAAPLGRLKEFMSANSAVIMMVIFVIFGAKLIGDGIGGLAT